MKKLIKLMLVCVLATSLCACGKSKYAELEKMLDNGEYSQAVNYINQLAYEAAKKEIEEKGYSQYLENEWIKIASEQEKPVNFEGNTVMIGDESYLWEEAYIQDDSIALSILDGGENIGQFTIQLNDLVTATLSLDSAENNYFANYIDSTKVEAIEITQDNIDTYFETVQTDIWGENSFGEVDSLQIQTRYMLKDEYHCEKINNMSNIAVKYTYSFETKDVDIDSNNKTYTLGNQILRTGSYSATSEFMPIFNKDTSRLGLPIYTTYLTCESETASFYKNVEFTQLQGTLYVLK